MGFIRQFLDVGVDAPCPKCGSEETDKYTGQCYNCFWHPDDSLAALERMESARRSESSFRSTIEAWYGENLARKYYTARGYRVGKINKPGEYTINRSGITYYFEEEAQTIIDLIESISKGYYAGWPDLVAAKDEEKIFIECKINNGKIEKHQLSTIEMIKKAGYKVFLYHVEGLRVALTEGKAEIKEL